MEQKLKINKSYFSLSSLKLDLYFNDGLLSTGTGFIIQSKGDYFLVTNYHILSGRDFVTNKCISKSLAIPNKLAIWHHVREKPGFYIRKYELILDPKEIPLYINGKDKANADVAILKLENIDNSIDIYDIDYLNHRNTEAILRPGHPMLIVGFPYGLSSYMMMPIWKNGILSSEIDFDFKGLNCFLIDAGTRGGMSGSPVFAYFPGGIREFKGGHTLPSNNYYKFVGVYSSRLLIPKEEQKKLGKKNIAELKLLGSDIGQVWKEEILDMLI